ncbi:GlsB/YeaQ/YmgE family stress response membrane protein [Capnocytophaga canimorsus]|uniref:GlsB/YeaQ/YmgE family stress response membrane protein n=1 Tax=Capnocytophaga canimorsus TaxID=28188 RepID=UPI001EDCE8A0|nr:GlsB/YeaQ/YmgE family stress response membrane protein [Capnocytophaga canimorsus]GJQ03665.1 membrane protein [Capnocytophaga canimorsus]
METGIIGTLIIGAIAGWLGGTIYKGSGLGLIGNIIVGILGSFVGYWLLGTVLNISLGGGWIGAILTGAAGAIVILFLLNLIFKGRK